MVVGSFFLSFFFLRIRVAVVTSHLRPTTTSPFLLSRRISFFCILVTSFLKTVCMIMTTLYLYNSVRNRFGPTLVEESCKGYDVFRVAKGMTYFEF